MRGENLATVSPSGFAILTSWREPPFPEDRKDSRNPCMAPMRHTGITHGADQRWGDPTHACMEILLPVCMNACDLCNHASWSVLTAQTSEGFQPFFLW